MLACENSNFSPQDHFVDVTEMVEVGSTELAANLFRATQTEDKLRRENIQGKSAAKDKDTPIDEN